MYRVRPFQSIPAAYRWPALAALLVASFPTGSLWSQQTPAEYFQQNCMSCHTIGGGAKKTGPDLTNVTQRAPSRQWLLDFIQDPQAKLNDTSDSYAQQIFEQSRRVPMPPAPNMTRDLAEKLLKLIEAESEADESQFKGVQISTEPFTPEDVVLGRRLFMGTVSLNRGGTACISCHSIHGLGGLGGGRLSLNPDQADLTTVFDRLNGRDALSSWLAKPSTETMQPIFKEHPLEKGEIHALVAYFKDVSKHQKADPTPGRVLFVLLGLGGAVGLMFAFDAIWKWRFRGVRGPLVEAAKTKGAS